MIHNHHGNINRLNAYNSHTNNTTNHIYLNSGANSSEYDAWMRTVGSLLHIGAEHFWIKPILDLFVAVIEPNRIFILDNPAIDRYNIKATTEVILIVDDEKKLVNSFKHFVRFASAKNYNVTISVHPTGKMERGLQDGHIYYSTHCQEKFLVFSGSRYRLYETGSDVLSELCDRSFELFYEEIRKAEVFLNLANEQESKQQYNIASLMLHQCLEIVYRSILLALNQEIPKTHLIEKLERKAAKFAPQILQALTNKEYLQSLDTAHDSQTFSKFDVAEICDVRNICDEVKILIEVSKIAFQDKQNRFFMASDVDNSEEDIPGMD